MEQVIHILREIKPDIDFEDCATLIDDELLDSFDIISIVAEFNAAFGIRIPAAEVKPVNFNSAQAMYAMIQRLQEQG